MKEFSKKSVMLFVFCACLAPGSWADELTKQTHMSINMPLQVGDILLAPGEYVFRLTDPGFDRGTVSIFNAKTNRLEGTVIGSPAYRVTLNEKQFTVSSPQPNEPAKLQTWFYPGDNFGVEFPRLTKVAETAKAGKSKRPGPDAGSVGEDSSTH